MIDKLVDSLGGKFLWKIDSSEVVGLFTVECDKRIQRRPRSEIRMVLWVTSRPLVGQCQSSLYQAPNGYAIYLVNSQTGEQVTYKHKDLDRLQLYIEIVHGEIKMA